MNKNLLISVVSAMVLSFCLMGLAFSAIAASIEDSFLPVNQSTEPKQDTKEPPLVEDTEEGPQIFQNDSAMTEQGRTVTDPDSKTAGGEASYQVPHELEAGYFEVLGNYDGVGDAMKLTEEETADAPPFFGITLPGAPTVQIPPNELHHEMESLLGGEAPLYQGGKIVRYEIFGHNHSIEILVPATPDEVFEFYQSEMKLNGWERGMSMKEKERGLIFFSKKDRELVFRIDSIGQKTRVSINMVGNESFGSQ